MSPIRQYVRLDRNIDLQPRKRQFKLQQINDRVVESMGLSPGHDLCYKAKNFTKLGVSILPSHRLC